MRTLRDRGMYELVDELVPSYRYSVCQSKCDSRQYVTCSRSSRNPETQVFWLTVSLGLAIRESLSVVPVNSATRARPPHHADPKTIRGKWDVAQLCENVTLNDRHGNQFLVAGGAPLNKKLLRPSTFCVLATCTHLSLQLR